MPGVPAAERPPGIKLPWLDVWRTALRTMKEQGTWSPALRPLLDEYVLALKSADDLRKGGVSADRDARRALALADALALTPRGRRAINLKSSEAVNGNKNPFDELDELAPRRKRRSQAS